MAKVYDTKLGACILPRTPIRIMIAAEIIDQYGDNSTERLNFDIRNVSEGVLIEIGDVHSPETQYMVEEVPPKKHWQTKILTRTALALLWALRELFDRP